jgi:cobalt-zinc-cadmium efflux system protein
MHSTTHASKTAKNLATALVITASFFVIELVGGIITSSLALQADAFHTLTDVSALSYALVAAWLAQRPATLKKTYGYYRGEILSAFLNGIFLWAIMIFIIYEAFLRLRQPSSVQSLNMLIIAAFGLVANVAVAAVLSGSRNDNLNVKGAYLHVLADLLGSAGAISAGLTMYLTGWYQADSIASLMISVLVFYSSAKLVQISVNILMEGVPPHIDIASLQRRMAGIDGVKSVHDLHVWSISEGKMCCLSAHVVTCEMTDNRGLLTKLMNILKVEFGIDHTTIQIEGEEYPKSPNEH